MKPASFAYHAPKSVDEAVSLLDELAPQDGRILAGGQSLVATMAFRMARPSHLIDINGIEELAKLSADHGVVRIGACVRHCAFDSDALTGATGALLRKVVRNIAHLPIRTRGTFCGSVANADPASEWCCVMAALDGVAVLRSPRGTRRVPAAELYQGVMATSMAEDELLIAAELPMLADDTRTGFIEFSRRQGDFAIAMALVTYRLEGTVIVEPRVAIGGAETYPRRISESETVLQGRAPCEATFVAAAEAAAVAIDPMEDINNTARYRRNLVRDLTQKALELAA
ncbi:FAD binding domain-containing protein [Undibacter mobilis]|uniref:Xanthine dehydrogenase family protein subunit M n=1 Tax=Undibacter mobilis TaxID=2292256 RepID=A0A371B3H2_9BRAD|nr:FAD binding domain-containing protein [Undibacter mobilis]RDV02011.1 xanthine dehydrogenase family protein subunit M [Undibacter mobilis]